jgi:hypothetical protein
MIDGVTAQFPTGGGKNRNIFFNALDLTPR